MIHLSVYGKRKDGYSIAKCNSEQVTHSAKVGTADNVHFQETQSRTKVTCQFE